MSFDFLSITQNTSDKNATMVRAIEIGRSTSKGTLTVVHLCFICLSKATGTKECTNKKPETEAASK